jgi:hypothetical protein
MTDVDGTLILQGLVQTRDFFKQVSLLIQTTEELLIKEGWREMFNSRVSSNVTSDLYYPDRWMPRDVFRLYVTADADAPARDILIYLSVHLDQVGAWGGFKEPWVACGLCKFLPGKRPDKVKAADYVNAHLVSERDPDGEFALYDHREDNSEWFQSVGLLCEKSMALPLVHIKSADDLSTKVVGPLLSKVDEAVKAD